MAEDQEEQKGQSQTQVEQDDPTPADTVAENQPAEPTEPAADAQPAEPTEPAAPDEPVQPPQPTEDGQAPGLPDLARELAAAQTGRDVTASSIDFLNDVELSVKIELGRTKMLVEDVLRLGDGSIVEIDKLAGDPVDIRVNERLVARGEVLVLNDNFCVRVSQIVVDHLRQ